jgi:Protein of unknown function (DUF3592)
MDSLDEDNHENRSEDSASNSENDLSSSVKKKKKKRAGIHAIPHPLVLLLFGMAFVPIGVGFQFVGHYILGRYSPVYSWKKTRGKIQEVWMTQKNSSTQIDGKNIYYPSVLYSFKVDGKEYRSQRQKYNGTPYYSSKERAEEKLRYYKQAQDIAVFYNPDNPNKSVLIRRSFKKTGWILKIGGVVVIVFGVLAILASLFLWFMGISRFKFSHRT